jgi:5'-deoxy-5'-methylthioadenosine phosphorylase
MLAVIGGSGLYSLGGDFSLEEQASRDTPFGDTSADILQGHWHDIPLVFLPRHGPGHRVPPHRVNYRANIWALKQLGVARIIAVNAVGGITSDMPPLTLALPDQVIDYSSGREHTFFDGDDAQVTSAELRGILMEVGLQMGQPLAASGTYGSTNGPRLESAAEIIRMRNDGCNLVGMTGMPEAALARELEIDYACLALVVNWAAGVGGSHISMQDILHNMEQGMQQAKSLFVGSPLP